MQRIPFTWLYALRAIQANLRTVDAISGFLGVPSTSAKSWLVELTVRGAITCDAENFDYSLTILGVEYLDSPEIERIATLPARLTWDCIRGEISDATYDELRAREQKAERALELHVGFKIPASGELSLPMCQNFLGQFLDEMGEELDGAELLHIQYTSKPTRAIKKIPVLLYGFSPEIFEIRIIGNDGFDIESARLVRKCPEFIRRLPGLFHDVAIADFSRRALLNDSNIIFDFGFDPRVVSSEIGGLLLGRPDKFRTFPGQGIRFLERAFSEATRVVRTVMTESRIADWDAFRSIVNDALMRGAICEIVLIHLQNDNRERVDRLAQDMRAKILGQVPQKNRSIMRTHLKILVKTERYKNHWVPIVMCDDEWLWCGSDMLPGGNGLNPHFGFFLHNKSISLRFSKLISEQITDVESPRILPPKIEIKKRRALPKGRMTIK
ncbi:hypothetical protein [Pseudomonas sp.]|uniref:hypothetical protein n=1 Tax=Pseudomonas sp. TaxID=306 RepID=UPI002614DF7D|nr:hypothetical protein [Pseudomonas sp.]